VLTAVANIKGIWTEAPPRAVALASLWVVATNAVRHPAATTDIERFGYRSPSGAVTTPAWPVQASSTRRRPMMLATAFAIWG
jgi:hypothetical protein